VQAAFEEAVAVSRRSWKHATSTGLEQPGPLAFMRQLTDVAFERGWLSIWLLRIDGTPVAMEHQLVHERRVYALRADYDESYAHASPGTYLNREIIRRLFDGGHERYYLGPGRNQYKKSWSATGEAVSCATVFAPSARGRALALRRLKSRMTLGWPRPGSGETPL
jgi:CelD/BcsL family acetyltransferase involved in cellulose biosynthesis